MKKIVLRNWVGGGITPAVLTKFVRPAGLTMHKAVEILSLPCGEEMCYILPPASQLTFKQQNHKHEPRANIACVIVALCLPKDIVQTFVRLQHTQRKS